MGGISAAFQLQNIIFYHFPEITQRVPASTKWTGTFYFRGINSSRTRRHEPSLNASELGDAVSKVSFNTCDVETLNQKVSPALTQRQAPEPPAASSLLCVTNEHCAAH